MRYKFSGAVVGLIGLATTQGDIRAQDRSAPTAVAPAKPIPVEAFAESPFFDSPALSPDGQHFAARIWTNGKSAVQIYPAALDGKPQTVELGKLQLNEISWAGNGRLLLQVVAPIGTFNNLLPIQRLLAVDIATGAPSVIDPRSSGPYGGEILYVDPDGKSLLLASQSEIYAYPSVKRVDLATGVVTLVEKPKENVWNWYADDQGVVRGAIAYTGNRWSIWYRPVAGAPLKKTSGRFQKEEDGSVEGVRFMAGSGKGIIVTNARTGRFAAYRYDFENGQIGDLIYERPDVDITAVRVNDATGEIEGVAYTDDRFRIAWLDPKFAEIQAKLDKALPGAENLVVSSNRDGKRLIVWSGAANDPGTYYLYDRVAKQLRPLASPYSSFENIKLPPVQHVRYAARDGLSIPAYLALPRGKSDRDLPLIVMPHGGPHVRDDWSFDPWRQFLVDRGYAVFQPNFRGSTGYGKDFVERGFGQWGRAMQDDIDDGVAWLVKSGTVDPKRVCIMGASYGGYAALWAGIRNPEIYRCAISFAGVTDVPAMLKTDSRAFVSKRYYKEWERKVQGLDKVDLAAVSPLLQAQRLNIPVLIAHGEDDTNVPAKQSHALVSALTKRGARVESVFYPDEGHGLTKPADSADFLKRVEAFLHAHNPA